MKNGYIGRNKGRGGFTLVELLVVIAIIAVLMSMLLPALKQAQMLAKIATCQASLRNGGLGYQFFSNDFNDGMPPQWMDANEVLAAGNDDGYSRWWWAGDTEDEARRSSKFFLDALVDEGYFDAQSLDCPESDGVAVHHDNSWNEVGPFPNQPEYGMSGYFSGYTSRWSKSWGFRGKMIDDTCLQEYMHQNGMSYGFGETWSREIIDLPEEGMLLGESGESMNYPIIYVWAGDMRHSNGGTWTIADGRVYGDGYNDVLFFDGHFEKVGPEKFWPTHPDHHSGNSHDAFWVPISDHAR